MDSIVHYLFIKQSGIIYLRMVGKQTWLFLCKTDFTVKQLHKHPHLCVFVGVCVCVSVLRLAISHCGTI